MTDIEVDNPYDPSVEDYEQETKQLDEVINISIDSKLLETHTMLPAVVVAVRGNQYVDIRPLLMRRYSDGTVKQYEVIPNVPVQILGGKDWWIKCPVAVGDIGSAIFSERSLDKWKASGGVVDPQDTRKHHLADAVFIPGLASLNGQVSGASDDMVLHNGSAEITLQKAGKFSIKNQDQELLQNLIDLGNTLSAASTIVGGPFTPDVITALNQFISNIMELKI